MELELSRVDYTLVGLTGPNCMKLLPGPFKEVQKVAVADNDGILQIFSVKKEDIAIVFKSLPGPEITSLQLGGVAGYPKDKIYAASENEVRGYTKKGKLFLTFDSGMTEPIQSMFVLGSDLFLCGKHIYNHYRDCKEIGSYLCGDKIIDVIALYQEKTKRLISLIACEGRMIRALEHARVTISMEVESSPTMLFIFEDDTKVVLFGTVDGRVGVLDIERSQKFLRWLIPNDKNNSAVSCMDSYDFTGNGPKNLIVGRQDGSIEVYSVNVSDEIDSPILIYIDNCSESVTSLQSGFVRNAGYCEILVSTYTGRIFGLTTEVIDKNVERGQGSNHVYSNDTSQKIAKLRSEIEDIQQKVIKEREKYQASTHSFFDELSAIPLLSIKDTFILNKDTSTYTLTIEAATAIDSILLQCNVEIELLDVEKNSAVVSYSDPDDKCGNVLLVTYRCQINTNRLEIKIRPTEGCYGILQAYVTPLVQPKCSRLQKYEIKPLSLHYRMHNFDTARDLNSLTIRGTFSLAEIHTWICQCLPEVPEKVTDRTVLNYQSTLLDTVLQCNYLKGEANFLSDNISTIAILKEYITSEATKKKIKVDISTSINDESINNVLKLIEPKLLHYQKCFKDVQLLDALNELEITEDETVNYLSPRYQDLLRDEKELRKKHQSQPGFLARLNDIITKLYVDYNGFKGINVKNRLQNVNEIVQNYSYDKLLLLFRPDSQNVA